MKEKTPDNHGMIRCDDEFEAVDQDLDMSTMGIVQGNRPYVMPDISRELALLDARLQESIKNKEDKHMLSIGTKVIVRTCDDYHGRHCGRVGTVCKHFAKDRRVGVMFDDIKNPASKDALQGTPYNTDWQRREERDIQRWQDYRPLGGRHQDHCHLRRGRCLRSLRRLLCRRHKENVRYDKECHACAGEDIQDRHS